MSYPSLCQLTHPALPVNPTSLSNSCPSLTYLSAAATHSPSSQTSSQIPQISLFFTQLPNSKCSLHPLSYSLLFRRNSRHSRSTYCSIYFRTPLPSINAKSQIDNSSLHTVFLPFVWPNCMLTKKENNCWSVPNPNYCLALFLPTNNDNRRSLDITGALASCKQP